MQANDTCSAVVRALVLYALAEAQAGHATVLRVTADGRSFSVADNGRGHPLAREVGGTPYLKLIYTHLDYPFGASPGAPVQLQGLGMSLINTLCSELSSVVRRPEGTLSLVFHGGALAEQRLTPGPSGEAGNLISGAVRPELAGPGIDIAGLRAWLQGVQESCPSVALYFNGLALHPPSPSTNP
jgi:DNA gyrase/topoisomerase IV subunit B